MRENTKIFKALANERRLNILKVISTDHELSVSDIAERINLSHKSTSKHLLILERAGFIKYRNVSLNTLYSIGVGKGSFQGEILKSLI